MRAKSERKARCLKGHFSGHRTSPRLWQTVRLCTPQIGRVGTQDRGEDAREHLMFQEGRMHQIFWERDLGVQRSRIEPLKDGASTQNLVLWTEGMQKGTKIK